MNIKTDSEKLVKAFDHMVDNVGRAIHQAEEALAPTIDEMIHNAQTLARDIYALSQEESEHLAEALKRDIQKANQAINQEQKELREWFSFDLELLEDRFIDLIGIAADKTWLDLHAFEKQNRQASAYHTGEVCSAGTLCCENCSKTLNFTRTSRIPPCPGCHHSQFYRVIS